jgi:hypothetical protein
MKPIKTLIAASLSAFAMTALTACAPEVGSEKWCAKMKEKPKMEWTAEEAGDYAKHCVFE